MVIPGFMGIHCTFHGLHVALAPTAQHIRETPGCLSPSDLSFSCTSHGIVSGHFCDELKSFPKTFLPFGPTKQPSRAYSSIQSQLRSGT